jgi:SAM-dependent methyltransferase
MKKPQKTQRPSGLATREYEWFNDEEFWDLYAPIMFDEARWAEVPAVVNGVIEMAGLKTIPVPRVLDVCCGFGRIAKELARADIAVTGVDITKSYLETAREEAAAEGLAIEYIERDARDFCRKDSFDAAVNLYNSFGYFENAADDALLVKNVFDSLKPGGVFIIDVLGKEIAVRDYVDSEWFERAGRTVLTESEPLDSWGYIWNKWTLFIAEHDDAHTDTFRRVEKQFVQRLYSATELRRLLLDTGFREVSCYGKWGAKFRNAELDPYDQHAATLIAAAVK